VGLAVFNAASEAWPDLAWSLKAPNDLLLAGKKCGGLLVETVSNGSEHRLLIGFGFNILNHPRKLSDATHLGESHGVTDSEWFQFLEVLNSEFEKANVECQRAELTETACRELASALNANPNLKSKITKISARGDIVSASGTVSWMDI
jgi:BirA family biotin operon repressor/biotin-[acetyl-CoA-carboxylase] ligase